jgi:hypothetical protein
MENFVYDMQQSNEERAAAPTVPKAGTAIERTLLVTLWLIVGVPMLWGVLKTLQVVQFLFQ